MLTTNPVVYAVNRTLAVITPKSLNGIRVSTTINIDSVAVVNYMVLIIPLNFVIATLLVHIEGGGALDIT